jgi:hypothetical protein
MKKNKVIFALTIAISIGTANSVALKDNAVGFAIGVAIFMVVAFFSKRKTIISKNDF